MSQRLNVSGISKKLLQSVTKSFYKKWQVLQDETEFIKKFDRYYKVWQKVITKSGRYDKVC